VTRRAAVASLVAVVAGGCTAGKRYGTLRVATGTPGGIYDLLGSVYVRQARLERNGDALAQTTGASVENLRLVAAGKADVGFATADAAELAMTGAAPFAGPQPIAALAALYDDYAHVVVTAASDITDLGQMARRRVSLGAPGSGSALAAERLLRLAGVARHEVIASHLGAAASARSLRDGTLDAFFFFGGVPTPAIAGLAQAVPIRLLPVGRYVRRIRRAYSQTYRPGTIQASAYSGLTALPVPSIRVLNLLVVSRDMGEETAFDLTRLLFDARSALARAHPAAAGIDPRSATATLPVPLHPGAVGYYRANKIAVGTSH
jgi:TRAP transporter TAXI family solute receptor